MTNENLAGAYLAKGTIGNTDLAGASTVHYTLGVVPSQNVVSGLIEVKQAVLNGNYSGKVTGKIYATGLGNTIQIVTISGSIINSDLDGAPAIPFEAHLAIDSDWQGTGGFSYADTHVENVPVQPDAAERGFFDDITASLIGKLVEPIIGKLV